MGWDGEVLWLLGGSGLGLGGWWGRAWDVRGRVFRGKYLGWRYSWKDIWGRRNICGRAVLIIKRPERRMLKVSVYGRGM